ncbi:S26 family signal peptidase, partial [Pseudomonas sp. AOB-7]|uniref:S26 family signal peptidase n=1 Tax=Pseudomonas sp. AOB-7 TaxID=2482750 RepID=UPI003531E372
DRGGDGAAARVHIRSSETVRVNGVLVTRLLRKDRQGRALPAWHTYRCLVGDELFLLSSTNPKSFGSRHFGPESVGGVIARMQIF